MTNDFIIQHRTRSILDSKIGQLLAIGHHGDCLQWYSLSLWLIGTVRGEPETVISRAWVQSPDPAE